MERVTTGLEHFAEGYWKNLKACRVGLLANQASLDSSLKPAKLIITQLFPGRLTALFGPQHGYAGADQDNMVETDHAFDELLEIPVFSLYAEQRAPSPKMLELIDVLIIDLQDVGTRTYTFAATMLHCLQAAANNGKKVIVLDRPNPLGGEVMEGNLLQPQLFSFVGPFRLPMRHGLTMGEMAVIFNQVLEIGCDLEIVPLKGWRRNMLWADTGLRWFAPSPNMPTVETAMVYPGQIVWEGTNISEGRGTCKPFEIFGAPFLDIQAIMRFLEPRARRGCHLQEYEFRPTFHKWRGETCRGFMLHILEPRRYRPYLTSIALLRQILQLHPKAFEWRKPPYEYEYHRKPIDLILGDPSLRRDLEAGMALSSLEEKWLSELEGFRQWRRPFLLYT
jgi:uncharacterized protein YbbC (DUF1343 family)